MVDDDEILAIATGSVLDPGLVDSHSIRHTYQELAENRNLLQFTTYSAPRKKKNYEVDVFFSFFLYNDN